MKQIKFLPTSKFFMMLVILMSLVLAASLGAHSQNVVQKGKTFVVASDTIDKDSYTKTEYFYQDKTGKYPIYLSANNKAFIWKVSKKTGKDYRKYLPEITKMLETKKDETIKDKR